MNSFDRVFLDRAYELAERGIGSTSPNPPVGAVLVKDGRIVGEGYHHKAGMPHAETEAIRSAGGNARGATLYVSLEPCNHQGKTPPCAPEIAARGVARVVSGTIDPNPRTRAGGIETLEKQGVSVEIVNDRRALAIVEPFARAITSRRPYVALKMAMSLDGFVVSERGTQQWLTGEHARAFVRELRITYDAVAVGAGTVRIDDPQLTVRPAHHREVPYRRVVFCERDPVDPESAVFLPAEGYEKTIVLAPKGKEKEFAALSEVGQVIFAGNAGSVELDLEDGLRRLRDLGIYSMVCEGGPTIARHLVLRKLVDRFFWLVAPQILHSQQAVPALFPDIPKMRFDRAELLEPDAMLSGTFAYDV